MIGGSRGRLFMRHPRGCWPMGFQIAHPPSNNVSWHWRIMKGKDRTMPAKTISSSRFGQRPTMITKPRQRLRLFLSIPGLVSRRDPLARLAPGRDGVRRCEPVQILLEMSVAGSRHPLAVRHLGIQAMGGLPGIRYTVPVGICRRRPTGDGAKATHLLRVANGLTALAERSQVSDQPLINRVAVQRGTDAEAGSKLDKAQALGVKIIDEADLLRLCGE